MIPRDALATRNRFGRVARIDTGVKTPESFDLMTSEVIEHLDMRIDAGKLVLEESRGVELARAA